MVTSPLALASLLMQSGQVEAAAPLAEQALELSESNLAEANEQLATTLKFISNVHMLQGSLDAAEDTLRRAVALSEATAGDDHPETARHIGNLAAPALQRGGYTQGR